MEKFGFNLDFQALQISIPSPKVKKKDPKKIQTLERIESEDVAIKKSQKSEKIENTSTSG